VLLGALVAAALDDFDAGRFDLETAFHALAHAAWDAGQRHGALSGLPDPRDADPARS
jgi:hypothetical protein